MRRRAARNPAAVVFLFYLLAFLVFFFYSIYSFPAGEDGLLARFQWPFIWSNGFLLFMDYALPVTVAAVALSYSLGRQGIAGGTASTGFGQLVSGHLVFLIVLAVLYSFFSLGLYPQVKRNLQALDLLSEEATVHLRQGEAAEEAGQQGSAVSHYESYLAVDPDNDEILDRVRELRTGLQATRPEEPASGQVSEAERYRALTGGRQAHELMELAMGFQEKEDYISAHHFYSLAARIDPTRADARRLAAAAWERIGDAGPDAEDREQSELYRQKQKAYSLFAGERYLQAYYEFLQLRERYPRDGELATWFQRSRDMVVQETFFLDEARKVDALPGREELLFVNRGGQGEREIVYIGKMASIDEGTFCKDIEVLRLAAGAAAQHFVAGYGKLLDGAINLHGIERTSREGPSLPRYLSGRPRGAEAPNILTLRPAVEELSLLGVGRTTAASVGLLELWQMRPRVAGYGHPEAVVSAEILRRLMLPFSFLVLALAAAAFGWGARPLHPNAWPVWIAYLFVPLFPLVALFFTSLYLHGQRILLDFCLLQLGFAAALPIFLVLQGVLLFTVLVLLAGQTGD